MKRANSGKPCWSFGWLSKQLYKRQKEKKKKEGCSEYTEPLLCVMSIVNKPFTSSSGVSWGRFKFLFDRHSKTFYDYGSKQKIHRVTSCSIWNRPIVSDILTMHDINEPKSNRLMMSARLLSNLSPYKSWRVGSIALRSIRESSKKKRERESFTKHLLLFASWIECNVLIEVNRPIRYPIFPEALNEANSNVGLNVGVARQQTLSPSGKKESIPRRTSNLNSWPSTLLYSTGYRFVEHEFSSSCLFVLVALDRWTLGACIRAEPSEKERETKKEEKDQRSYLRCTNENGGEKKEKSKREKGFGIKKYHVTA